MPNPDRLEGFYHNNNTKNLPRLQYINILILYPYLTRGLYAAMGS